MTKFEDYIRRKEKEFGSKFDKSDLTKKFIPYFNSGERIKVETPYGEVKFGTVGVTTGWKPAFLLMSRSSAYGSSELLDSRYKILAVKKGRKYV